MATRRNTELQHALKISGANQSSDVHTELEFVLRLTCVARPCSLCD